MKDFRNNPDVRIRRNGKILLPKARIAQSLMSRLRGLLGSKRLDENEGLLITNCKQVHTFFMRYPIDVVFLDEAHTILQTQTLKPWRISSYFVRAKNVLEVPAGFSKKNSLKAGEALEVGASS